MKENLNTLKDLIAKKSVKRSRLITLICAIAAALLTLTLFLPVVSIHGDSYSLLGAADKMGGSSGDAAAASVWFVIFLCAGSVVWTMIEKKWAAVTGAIYAFLPMILCVGQAADWMSNDIDMTFFGILMLLLPIVVTLLAIARAVLILKEEKENRSSVPLPKM